METKGEVVTTTIELLLIEIERDDYCCCWWLERDEAIKVFFSLRMVGIYHISRLVIIREDQDSGF